MDLEEKKYWVLFNIFQGIGPIRFKLLLNFFGSAKRAFQAKEGELLEIGLGEKLVEKFIHFRKENFDIDSYFLRLKKLKIDVLCFDEKNYPKLLKEIQDYPPVLYVQKSEDFNFEEMRGLAVVGTRKATSYGRQVTEMIVRGLIDAGFTIISGLARGIDEVAHKTAIESRGRTLGVLGCGLDLVYPPEHRDLAEEIVSSGGVLVSEYPLGTPALPGNFPARNRIISGLSLGIIVTEAAEDSGSLITASWAAEQGREVFAVPGPITSPLSKGTAELIKKGARLVCGVDDILEELGMDKDKRVKRIKELKYEGLSEEEKSVVEILKDEALHIDEVIRRLGWESGKVGSILSLLEIKGIVRNFGDGVYGVS